MSKATQIMQCSCDACLRHGMIGYPNNFAVPHENECGLISTLCDVIGSNDILICCHEQLTVRTKVENYKLYQKFIIKINYLNNL